MDLVVENSGQEHPLWVETKSYNKDSENYKSNWSAWSLTQKGTSNLRQYFLDRVAMTSSGGKHVQLASDTLWWLHSFKKKVEQGYGKEEISYVRKQFEKLPKAGKGWSTGQESRDIAAYSVQIEHHGDLAVYAHKAQKHAKLFSTGRWLTQTVAQYLLADYPEDAKKAFTDPVDTFDPEAEFSL